MAIKTGYVTQILSLNSLASDIIEEILAGIEPDGLSIATLTKQPIPKDWNEQRRLYGFQVLFNPPSKTVAGELLQLLFVSKVLRRRFATGVRTYRETEEEVETGASRDDFGSSHVNPLWCKGKKKKIRIVCFFLDFYGS